MTNRTGKVATIGDCDKQITRYCSKFLVPSLFARYSDNHKYLYAQITFINLYENCPDYLF